MALKQEVYNVLVGKSDVASVFNMPPIDENLDDGSLTLTNTIIGNGSITISRSPGNELSIVGNQEKLSNVF